MALAQDAPLALQVNRLFHQIAEESRWFWTPRRVKLAVGIVVGMLVLEVLIAAAFFAGATGERGRAPLILFQVVWSFLGLTSQWARAIFQPTLRLEIAPPGYEMNLRDPFSLTSDFLHDIASIVMSWVLPVIGVIAFTSSTREPLADETPARRFLRISAAPALPLALLALTLSSAALVIRDVLPALSTPPADPAAYPVDRLAQVPWESVWLGLLWLVLWIVPTCILVTTLAAAWPGRQQALAACFGTTLFVLPTVGMVLMQSYPGGYTAVPMVVAMLEPVLVKLLLAAIVLPLALRRLRAEPPAL